ncbi:unnamed protein product [Brassica napus]|uniref:(rape) hypothetical protein n=1 Tax=Brassica napus TaxID=3708 RepID=A0A816WPS7_BRANA|nr:unnamed protein product [Brassica napus]
MYGHISSSIASDDTCPGFLYSENILAPPLPHDHHPHYFLPPPPLMMSHHSLVTAEAVSGFGYFDSSMTTGGGGCSSCDSPSSMGSGGESLVMQRSMSSHNGFFGNLPTTAHDFVNDHDGPVRRALSAGDLPRSSRRESSAVLSESNAIIEGMSKAYKYSPEEKKEKIEKYRSKRNLRNFNKRIKYECRKTLADSRPRIRGDLQGMMRFHNKNKLMLLKPWLEILTRGHLFLDSFSANHFLN